MYAIVKIGSFQFKVSPGDVIDAPLIEASSEKAISLEEVLLFADDKDIRIGRPFLKDVKVAAKLLRQHLGPKVLSFKFKRRKDYSLRKGHRQKLMLLEITKIEAGKE